jgi:flagellar biosynthesis/type III secretory pathway protein FliH
MSFRARVVARQSNVVPFSWSDTTGESFESVPEDVFAPAMPTKDTPQPVRLEPTEDRSRAATLERDAFATAYAQGEKAGVEAGSKRTDAMLRRLSDSLRELEELRRSMIRQTEHQIVQLAVEMARRILRREVQTDNDLLCAMARVALDRLGDTTPATIRLNPEDYHTIAARHGGTWAGNHVTVVADPAIGRGGCMVESSFGFIDASVDAQFKVLEQALLGEEGAPAEVVTRGAA